MNRRIMNKCFVLAILLAVVGGCVQESTDGATQTFSYELWLPVCVLLGGIVAAPAGWYLREYSGRLGWALLIGGPIAAIFFAPSLFRDRAIIDDAGFSLRTGIWGLTAVHEVKFDDIKVVRVTAEEVTGRRGRKETKVYMICERKDGT
ncbi:MAG TPA: hypothetical protein VGG30_05180, partial [Pirellulales bacterium]